MNMALFQGRPNILGSRAFFDKGTFGWSTLHSEKSPDSCVVDLPITVSARFKLRVGGGKRAIKVQVETRGQL